MGHKRQLLGLVCKEMKQSKLECDFNVLFGFLPIHTLLQSGLRYFIILICRQLAVLVVWRFGVFYRDEQATMPSDPAVARLPKEAIGMNESFIMKASRDTADKSRLAKVWFRPGSAAKKIWFICSGPGGISHLLGLLRWGISHHVPEGHKPRIPCSPMWHKPH